VPHVHGQKHLDYDAFAASREYVTVQRLKGLNALLSASFGVEYLVPQTY